MRKEIKEDLLRSLFLTSTFTLLMLIGCCLLGCASTPPQTSTPQVVKYRPAVAKTAPPPETLSPFPGQNETLNPFPAEPVARRKPLFAPQLPPIQEVGWLYRPPRGWILNQPRSHRFTNDTNFTVRVFLDGKELNLVTAGTIALTPVDIGGVVRPKAMVPSRAEVYHIGDPGEHTIIIELYDGPAPLKYIKTCQLNSNFTKNPNIYFSYRPCYQGSPSI